MSGRFARSKVFRYVGAIAALIGVVGYTVFGWRFGENDGVVPLALGIVFALTAVGWTLYQRL